MVRQVKVTIDALGNPRIEAIGFGGVGCTETTKLLEDALAGAKGGVTRELKPEWYESTDTNNDVHDHLTW